MKYKLKDSYKSIYNRQFEKDQIIDSNDEYTGIVIEVPFTDTRFFEPIKTRTFQVEMEEKHVESFDFLLGSGQYNHDDRWTVTEITEPTVPFWVIEFTSGHVNTSIKSFEGIDPVWIVNNFKGQKLYAIKWVKDHTSAWLKDCKDLVDYIFDTFN